MLKLFFGNIKNFIVTLFFKKKSFLDHYAHKSFSYIFFQTFFQESKNGHL